MIGTNVSLNQGCFVVFLMAMIARLLVVVKIVRRRHLVGMVELLN